MVVVCVALAFALLSFCVWQERGIRAERKSFAVEREVWVRERRDLNNRIQIPEAAPYMDEKAEPSDDDLPTLPGLTMTEEEREKAIEELRELGYAEGPAL